MSGRTLCCSFAERAPPRADRTGALSLERVSPFLSAADEAPSGSFKQLETGSAEGQISAGESGRSRSPEERVQNAGLPWGASLENSIASPAAAGLCESAELETCLRSLITAKAGDVPRRNTGSTQTHNCTCTHYWSWDLLQSTSFISVRSVSFFSLHLSPVANVLFSFNHIKFSLIKFFFFKPILPKSVNFSLVSVSAYLVHILVILHSDNPNYFAQHNKSDSWSWSLRIRILALSPISTNQENVDSNTCFIDLIVSWLIILSEI